ncbi:MAG: hypothetical protein Q4F77_02530 [Acinetobacter sp.]|uniref:hypothetical protein n=1 Tax=Acinetobacter sp. TaxID=472 RepID=UPI0026E0CE5A|nr:hypothetical protein [Acinetobacter sp.]MDO5542163.1 hypothetical protein [Acinetobacter sp.]
MKRIVIFIAILSGFTFNQHVFANTSEMKLKKKCIQQYPWMEGESDAALRGIYTQICDKKNRQNKNNLLIQAAQQHQQLGQNFKALQLVSYLHAQDIQSTALTDVQFMASTQMASSAIEQMRRNEVRYLSEEQTYPAAKNLVDAIEQAKPAPVLAVKETSSYVKKSSKKSLQSKPKKQISKVIAKSLKKEKTVTTQPVKTVQLAAAPSSTNPFATLKK